MIEQLSVEQLLEFTTLKKARKNLTPSFFLPVPDVNTTTSTALLPVTTSEGHKRTASDLLENSDYDSNKRAAL